MVRFSSSNRQSGNTPIGFVVGLVVGLTIAVAVALYITNAPVPFVTKVHKSTAAVDPSTGGKLPDPNKPLYNTAPPRSIEEVKGDTKLPLAPPPSVLAPATPPPMAALPPTTGTAPPEEAVRYQLQAGAFRTPEDADGMRARLAMLGLDAKVYPVEQGGTTLYRVRLGPYGQIDDLNRIRKTLAENGVEAQVIRLR
jgi:cell division protein FtsN